MTDRPLVSVLIPAYNAAWCITRALDSVHSQDFRDFELLVVNDGSTDETGEVLATYGSSVRVIVQANGGMSNARNAGIRASRGTFIAFLDADDWWLPEKLQRQVALMRSQPNLGYCSAAARVENSRGELLNLWQCRVTASSPLKTLFAENAAIAGGCSSVMVRKDLLEQVGLFDESLRGFEDPDLWIRLAASSDYACIEEPLVVVLRREESVSRNLDVMRDATVRSLRKNRSLLPHTLQGSFWRRSLASAYVDYAKWEYRESRTPQALSDIARAFWLAPLGRGRLCAGLLRDILFGRPV